LVPGDEHNGGLHGGVSGTLLASSTLIVNDIVKRLIPTMNEWITTFLIGVVTIICVVWIQDIWVALDVLNAILSGSIFFPIIFGFFRKKLRI
jgi:SSS family solute:Na+ symporter